MRLFIPEPAALFDSLVETDPTAFYTYEEYNTAAETLYQVVSLRGESILGQINGTIPSTREAQQSDSSALVDASDLDLTVMGTMNAGGGGQDEKGGPGVNDRSGAGKAPMLTPLPKPAQILIPRWIPKTARHLQAVCSLPEICRLLIICRLLT